MKVGFCNLQEKVIFSIEICLSELIEVGKQIAMKCQGLPLSIVVIGGLLAKTEKTLDRWKQVAQSITSYIHNVVDDILTLSYNHLPDHLKPCYLYIGAFPEDYEIPVSKLIWLWIAEGFIAEKSTGWRPEDVAEGYLLDLIERSLILIANRGSDGGIKSCRIHDLLGDLCRKKAKEEKFLEHIYRYHEQVVSSSSSSPHTVVGQGNRLCIYMNLIDYISSKPSYRDVCTFMYFANKWSVLPLEFTPFIYEAFRDLRVLDLLSIHLELFPGQLALLVHLRYLALRAEVSEIPASVSTLNKLETFIVKGVVGIIRFPISTLWNMTKLRHLHVNESCSTYSAITGYEVGGVLEDLQTLSTVVSWAFIGQEFLKLTPNLRKLRCYIRCYVSFSFPTKLETLKVLYNGPSGQKSLPNLPLSLKKISLHNFPLSWYDITDLGRLPNLEVLKLYKTDSDGGWCWETSDRDFPKLKFLKLDSLNIEKWKASSDHFPSLERLILNRCRQLEEIPLSMGDIPMLQMIEVRWCSKTATKSAKQIQEYQNGMGNYALEIQVHPPDLEIPVPPSF